jgi:hypothetical protein
MIDNVSLPGPALLRGFYCVVSGRSNIGIGKYFTVICEQLNKVSMEYSEVVTGVLGIQI